MLTIPEDKEDTLKSPSRELCLDRAIIFQKNWEVAPMPHQVPESTTRKLLRDFNKRKFFA